MSYNSNSISISISDDERHMEEEEEEEEDEGSVTDHEREADGEEEDDDEDDDSAHGTHRTLPKEGLLWQSNNANANKRKRRDTSSDADKHSKLTEYQRKLRNAREKRRSGKICHQFDHIRDTMVKAGVIVPKGTKGTILAAAKEYITMLQERQKRMALDNCLLVHQLAQIGDGALGVSASNLVRQIAERNGVTDIVWPNQAQPQVQVQAQVQPQAQAQTQAQAQLQRTSFSSPVQPDQPDYAVAFRKAPVAMAIATLGGNFIDCNDQFTQVTTLTKPQVQSQTIFTLIDQEELTDAFDRISQWIFSIQTNSNAKIANTTPTIPILLKSVVADANPIDEDDDPRLQVCLSPIQQTNTNYTNLRYLCVTLVPRSLASTLEPLFFTDDDQDQDDDEYALPVQATTTTNNNNNSSSSNKNLSHDPTTTNTYYAVG